MSNQLREWTVVSMLEWGTTYFKQKNIPDPRHSIEWLLAETLQIKRLDLYLQFDRPLSQDELDRIRPMVKRRAKHEPLQYIIGFTEFMNAHIQVSPAVLIPRIETEQLVEIILKDYPETPGLKVFDIGTGSGCIPIAFKIEQPQWTVTGLDISTDALELARQNAEINKTDVRFIKGDILDPESIPQDIHPDIIVSNPPYVLPEEKEQLEPQVTAYEPEIALFCDDLKQMYGNIIRFAEQRLSPKGSLYLEVHELHAEEIASLFPEFSWKCTVKKDYENKQRFVVGRLIS